MMVHRPRGTTGVARGLGEGREGDMVSGQHGAASHNGVVGDLEGTCALEKVWPTGHLPTLPIYKNPIVASIQFGKYSFS